MGFNPFVTWEREEHELKYNMGGEDKVFPLGPECIFLSKTLLPCFPCCSENGSITAKLLTEIFLAINNL
jgi:hypothetical protein